ncbi:TRAP-type C4-dicarboxylate transport system substrate-binding protein [Neobacillus niacini]|uniref:TRAP transporter substrate-binding protein n=1 Tax=Neobacillus niacini TaxID=86668 RepID=UPI002781E048|nr:TRAP transporter substrate-binding protein DctP [Neobacillus niacini]MDQ1002193.1 TRAP-type C4-dicarboxylate transport system substrate-binding protein [Neobacillus niacini]
MCIRRLIIIGVTLSIVLFLAACGGKENTNSTGGESGKGAEEITMVANFLHPNSHHTVVNAYKPWVEYVEEKTNGRVKVELYTGGALGSSTTVLQDVSGGVYDFGGPMTPTYHYDTEIFPLTIGDLPFAFSDIESAANVMDQFIEKHAQETFKDIVYMGVTANDPFTLISSKPINTFEQMKGLKIKVGGTVAGELAKSLGSTPVAIAYEDTYDALQKGIVDAALFPGTGSISNSYYEVAPYMTNIPAYMSYNVPVMNRAFYDNLPDDLKKLFEEDLAPKLVELYEDTYLAEIEKLETEWIDAGGNEFINLPEEEMKKFKRTAKPIWDQWVEEANKRGYPGEEMMEDFIELIESEGLETPF